jgi:hypothetical protein
MLEASVIGSPRHSRRRFAHIENIFDGSQDWVIIDCHAPSLSPVNDHNTF